MLISALWNFTSHFAHWAHRNLGFVPASVLNAQHHFFTHFPNIFTDYVLVAVQENLRVQVHRLKLHIKSKLHLPWKMASIWTLDTKPSSSSHAAACSWVFSPVGPSKTAPFSGGFSGSPAPLLPFFLGQLGTHQVWQVWPPLPLVWSPVARQSIACRWKQVSWEVMKITWRFHRI